LGVLLVSLIFALANEDKKMNHQSAKQEAINLRGRIGGFEQTHSKIILLKRFRV